MKLAAKLALGSCAVAVGMWGVLAYISADDERRDFVRGSSRKVSVLPADVLVVDAEVDDEYDDTDDEAERADELRLNQVRPVAGPHLMMFEDKEIACRRPTPAAMSSHRSLTTTKIGGAIGGPETVEDEEDPHVSVRLAHDSKAPWVPRDNNSPVETCA